MKLRTIALYLLLGATVLHSAVRTARAGSIVRLFYDNISSSSSLTSVRNGVSTLTNAARFPNNPSYREQLDDFTSLPGIPLRAGLQGKDNSGVDYGSWIRGYLEAPATGDYVFGVASDDASELWLSTDHTAEKLKLIAYETESGATLFGGPRLAERNSAAIGLTRGNKYYFEVRHKQGGGGSYIQVGWQRPDGVQEIIPALHLAQYPVDLFKGTGSEAQPPLFNTAGLNQGNLPATLSVAEGDELLLQLDVIAAQPSTVQWTRNGAIIPGENLSFLRIARTPATLNGAKIQATVRNEYGVLTSAAVTVSVTADVTPPTVLAVNTSGNPNLLEVGFSEPLEHTGAQTLANYEVRNSAGTILPVASATLLANEQTVRLAGAFNFQAGASYQITIRGIKDQASAPNSLSPPTYVGTFAFTASTGTTYDFNSGLPSGFRTFGNSSVTNSGSFDGSGFLQLTSSFRNQNGAVLLTERRDIDQVRLRFKLRLGDGDSTSGVDEPGDGFSINIAGDIPLGTVPSAEEGFTPDVPGSRISFAFDSHRDSSLDDPGISVILNNVVVTNVPVGSASLPRLTDPAGRWVDVDIDLRRSGILTLSYDGKVVIDHLPTAFEVIPSAQIGFAARTRTWYQTHWIDNLNVNFGEGDIGVVAIDPASELGDRSFPEGSEAKLSVLPTGAGPFQYQWFKDGKAILGETGRAIRFAAVEGAGGLFSVTVKNAFSEISSTPGRVTIVPDSVPPQVVSIRGAAGGVNQVTITFDEALDPDTATDPATYSSPLFKISSLRLGADGRSVVLQTTAQRVGVTYPLNISGLKDRSVLGNALTASVSFTSTLTYADEVLADQPSRYYRFEETSGTVAFTDAVLSDRTSTNAAYLNLPILGVPSLVPSAPDSHAAQFVSANTNRVNVPNGGDVNDFRGPWPQKSFEFWFSAKDTPPLNGTGLNAAVGLYEEGGAQRGIQFYLWRDPAVQDKAQAELVFHAYNSSPDGPGAPFGLLTLPPVYAHATIRTNTPYHVIGVFDGRTDSRDGELRLYINGELAGRSTNGVGQIYNHNGDIQIAGGNARTHDNVSGTLRYFDGVIDDFSLYNTALSEDRIRAHHAAGVGTSLVATNPPTVVSKVTPAGNPNKLTVVVNQPVSAATAQKVANYSVRSGAGAAFTVQSAVLLDDLVTVRLTGTFNFQPGASYTITVQGVADLLSADNVVQPVATPFTFVSAGPVTITAASDISDRAVTENQRASFRVVPGGEPPFSYQWFLDGAPLAGRTNALLAFDAPLSSAGAYTVRVDNEFSSVTSAAARLTVRPDGAAPQLLGVTGLAGSLNEIRLSFDEPLNVASATSVTTYAAAGLTIQSASLSDDGREVTLRTSTQTHGHAYQVSVAGLRDRAATPNSFTGSASFVSSVSYRDEVISEGAVRYWPFNETSGVGFHTLVSHFDTTPQSLIGVLTNGPTLGVPSLVPNLPKDTAVAFSSSSSNRIDVPNGRDLNAILGPWDKITHLFHFKAGLLPRVNGTNVDSAAIYAHSRIAFYLYGTQDTNKPTEALLVFTAQNNASEGPGSPWGGLSGNPDTSKYVATTIKAGQVYHVAGILDGDSKGFSGQLRLYVDGQSVGFTSGIGQIYKHPNNFPNFGVGSYIRHDGVSQSFSSAPRFDGVVDEFAVTNEVLPAARIAELFNYSQTAPAVGSTPSGFTSIRIESGNLVIRWDGDGQLQEASAITGPFTTVTGAKSPYSKAQEQTGQRFYRLNP